MLRIWRSVIYYNVHADSRKKRTARIDFFFFFFKANYSCKGYSCAYRNFFFELLCFEYTPLSVEFRDIFLRPTEFCNFLRPRLTDRFRDFLLWLSGEFHDFFSAIEHNILKWTTTDFYGFSPPPLPNDRLANTAIVFRCLNEKFRNFCSITDWRISQYSVSNSWRISQGFCKADERISSIFPAPDWRMSWIFLVNSWLISGF